jgi:hypothetical protein
MPDLYFEIDIMIDNLAKSYGVPNTNYYFRINNIKPSKEDYRKKVVEYIYHYLYTVDSFKDTPNYNNFKEYVISKLEKEKEKIIKGNNKDVEKRYTYYLMNEYIDLK